MFVPSADDVAALAEANLIKKVQADMEEEGEETVEDENKAVEFPLGDLSATFIHRAPTGLIASSFVCSER